MNIKKVAVILTVLGALGFTVSGISGVDFISELTGGKRTIGGDFLRILIGVSAVFTIVLEFKNKK